MSRVVVSGAYGRMGKTLVTAARQDKHITLVGGTVKPGSELRVGDILLTHTLHDLPEFDCLIDFTRPDVTLQNVVACLDLNCAMVIGTTGFDNKGLAFIQKSSEFIPIILASNTSVGINICYFLLKQLARKLNNECDVAILEKHHKYKIDSPSGTALNMGKILENEGISQIQYQSIRGGDIIGEHTCSFMVEGETIEITHKASSRMTYARGAMNAAKWLKNKAPGLYAIQDVFS